MDLVYTEMNTASKSIILEGHTFTYRQSTPGSS